MEKQEHFKEKYNKISVFLTKFIFGKNFDTLKNSGFVNSFISDPEVVKIIKVNEIYKNKKFLFLLFNNKKLKIEDIKKIITSLIEIPDTNIIFSYELIDNYFMIVLEFPELFNRDYDLILQGRYSKLSQKFKDGFPSLKDVYNSDNVKIGMEYSIYYHIFNKTDWLRDFWLKKLNLVELDKSLEFWEMPKEEEIIFDIKKLIKDK